MAITRREFGRVAVAGVPAFGVTLRGSIAAAGMQAPAPMSRWAGVHVGLNVPNGLGIGNNVAAEDILKQMVELGVGSAELRAQPVEHFLGSPQVRGRGGCEGTVVFGTSIRFLQQQGWRQIDILAEEVLRRSPGWTCTIIGGVLEQECNALFEMQDG